MLTPVNTCQSCGFRAAMNQGIRLKWGDEPREWTCFSCVALAQELLFSKSRQLDPPEFRYIQTPRYTYYYYLPA